MLFLIAGIVYGYLTIHKDAFTEISDISLRSKFIFLLFVFIVIFLFIYSIFLPLKKNRIMYKVYNTTLPARAGLWKNFYGTSPMGNSYDSVIMFNNILKTYNKEKENIRNWNDEKKKIVIKEIDEIINLLSYLVEKSYDYNLVLISGKMCYVRMYITGDANGEFYKRIEFFLKKAKEISSLDPQLYWLNADLFLLKGDISLAKESLEKSLILDPYLKDTHLIILEFAKKTKDTKYYDFALERAKEKVPNFISDNN